MSRISKCDYCGSSLDAGREFVYEFESLNFAGDDDVLAHIRSTGLYFPGKPLRTCRTCSEGVVRNSRERFVEESSAEVDSHRARKLLTIGGAILMATIVVLKLFGPERSSRTSTPSDDPGPFATARPAYRRS